MQSYDTAKAFFVQEDALKTMHDYQVQPEAWVPLGGGRYTPFESEVLKVISDKHGKTIGQVISTAVKIWTDEHPLLAKIITVVHMSTAV